MLPHYLPWQWLVGKYKGVNFHPHYSFAALDTDYNIPCHPTLISTVQLSAAIHCYVHIVQGLDPAFFLIYKFSGCLLAT